MDNLPNLDAAESVYFIRELEHIAARTYDIKRKVLKGRQFVPTESVPNGTEIYTYRQWDMTGIAKMLANYADDIPRVDVLAREFSSKCRGMASAYGYSVQDIRAAMQANKPLEQSKANAARRAIDERFEVIVRTGDSALGLTGFLNVTNASLYVVAAGATGLLTWASKSPREIVADMHGIANSIVISTKEIEIPDTLILPTAAFTLVSTTPMGDGMGTTTILEFFLKSSPYVTTVVPWEALTGAGAGGLDRMVCYRRDPEVVRLIVPQEFEQFPAQAEGLGFVVNCHARSGGVVSSYPLAIAYSDGI